MAPISDGIQSHHFMANGWESNGNSDRLYILGLQNPADGGCNHELKDACSLGKKLGPN